MTKQRMEQLEREVLDIHHRQYYLLRCSVDDAVASLFSSYGNVFREETAASSSFAQSRFRTNSMTYGLNHCLRWVLTECQRHGTPVTDPSGHDLALEATRFLGWGTSYGLIANNHVAWRAGTINAEVDEATKTITYAAPDDASPSRFVRQVEAQQNSMNERLGHRPESLLREEHHEWMNSLQIVGPRVTYDHSAPSWPVFTAMRAYLSDAVLPTISHDEDLGSFTIGNFVSFLAGLLPLCRYLTLTEEHFDHTYKYPNHLGSFAVSMPRREFVKWISQCARLPQKVASAVLELLSFDPERFHSRVVYSPFVVTHTSRVFFSPRILWMLDYERLLVGALNFAGRTHQYDRLITTIEKCQLLRINEVFKERGHFESVCEKTFVAEAETKTPDFVLFEEASHQVLVIDYKHSMEAGGIREQLNKLGDQSEWEKQLREYISMFATEPEVLRQQFPKAELDARRLTIDGIILTRWPLPLPASPDTSMKIADWSGLQGFLRSHSDVTIESFLDWVAERPDVESPTNPKASKIEIPVGDWTYSVPTLGGDEAAD